MVDMWRDSILQDTKNCLLFFGLDVFNGQIYINDGLISLLCKKSKVFLSIEVFNCDNE
jgi:hypothetical protein